MPHLAETDHIEDLEFTWGKKRGVGGKNKDVRFYESFTYDGVEYALHDCVYMYKEGEPEPYIGKLTKIWETPDKNKKVKVQWFFHPLEISNWLGDTVLLEKEVFLASGKGVGAENVNPLERSRWFRERPWDERMKKAYNLGTLVHLLNLDPEYTSRDVEDIIWQAFKEYCSAKMVQRTGISSPHSGEAFIILRTNGAANKIVKELDEGCLMLSNGRPLVGAPPPPQLREDPAFFGHLFIDRVRFQMQREMRDAVSTSHFSQPNTIEYEMAMEWRLLQSRSDRWWKQLYEEQGEQLRMVKGKLRRR